MKKDDNTRPHPAPHYCLGSSVASSSRVSWVDRARLTGLRLSRIVLRLVWFCLHYFTLTPTLYRPPRVPQSRHCRDRRELIKKIWEVDPLSCPRCDQVMRIIS